MKLVLQEGLLVLIVCSESGPETLKFLENGYNIRVL